MMLRRVGFLSLLSLLALLPAALGPASAGPVVFKKLTVVSGPTPFKPGCEGAPQTGTLYPNAEVEPWVAVNPGDPRHIVGVWQQDRYSNGGARGLLAAVSFNGGKNWQISMAPFSRCSGGSPQNGGDYERASDPWVTFAPNGDVYQIAIAFNDSNPINAVLVSKSTDGGKTWGNPVTLIRDTAPTVFNDKESITADPNDARFVYAVWDRLVFPAEEARGRAPERAIGFRGPAWFARTTDGGQTWTSASFGLSSPFVEAVLVSPTFPKDRMVLAGTREGGLFRSFDAGRTWAPVDLWGTRPSITALAASPAFAHDQTLFAATEGAGVLRSTNGGKTWNPSNFGLLDLTVLALAVSPNFARDETVYAATASGIYRSPNGGRAWRLIGEAMGELVVQCLALSPAFAEDRTLFAGTEEHGLLKSTDRGQTWRQVNTGLTNLCINAIAVSPRFAEDRTVLVGTAGGLFISRDGGETWTPLPGPEAVLTLAYSPDGRLILAGAPHEGVFRSPDGGQTWQASNTHLYGRLVVGLVLSPAFAQDQTLFTVSLEDGVARSTDGGATWQLTSQGLPTTQLPALVISPAYPEDRTLFVGGSGGVFRSTDGGETWALAGLADTEVRALDLSPAFAQDRTLLAGASEGRLFLSTDGGTTWRALSHPFAEQEILAVAFSPHFAEDRIILVGTVQEASPQKQRTINVWRSESAGERWQCLVSQPCSGRWVTFGLPPSYRGGGTMFIGIDHMVLRPMAAAHLGYKGTRQLWTAEKIAKATTAVVSLAVSPAFDQDQTVYAGTSEGVFKSTNGGLAWRPLNEGLENRSVVKIVLPPQYPQTREVLALTLGGALWHLIDRP